MQLTLFDAGFPERKPDTASGKKVPPTLEDVQQYCEKRKNGIDPETFFYFYEVNGWVQGKGKKIKNWKACVITWEKRDGKVERQSAEKQAVRSSALEAWGLACKAAKAWNSTMGNLRASTFPDQAAQYRERWDRIVSSLPPRLVTICEQFGWKNLANPSNVDVVRGQFLKAWSSA